MVKKNCFLIYFIGFYTPKEVIIFLKNIEKLAGKPCKKSGGITMSKNIICAVGLSLLLGISTLVLGEEKKEGVNIAGVNIGGDFNFRYRQNISTSATSPGFQLYEVEFFVDTNLNKNVSLFFELPLYHSNAVDLGNAWADFHKEDELAATGFTGVMVGHIAPWFGYYGYDDNQSWIYGGRTTTNTTLVRGQKVDGLALRDRQVGIAGNIKLDLKESGSLLFTPQIYNGAGYWAVAGGTDNDRKQDLVFRAQYSIPNELGVVGAGYWNAPKTKGATANSSGTRYGSGGQKHVRDVERVAVFFKYPDVQQASLPDLSLGGKPFIVYGEYITGTHKGNSDIAGYTTDQKLMGYWVEANANILRDKLVGILRYDFFDPNTDKSADQLVGITPALKWESYKMVFLTLNYEYYDGGKSAGTQLKEDRIVLEMSIQF